MDSRISLEMPSPNISLLESRKKPWEHFQGQEQGLMLQWYSALNLFKIGHRSDWRFRWFRLKKMLIKMPMDFLLDLVKNLDQEEFLLHKSIKKLGVGVVGLEVSKKKKEDTNSCFVNLENLTLKSNLWKSNNCSSSITNQWNCIKCCFDSTSSDNEIFSFSFVLNKHRLSLF